MFQYCCRLAEETTDEVPPGKSCVTVNDVQRARGRQRRLYSGATEGESAQLSSLPPSATRQASSSPRSRGNLCLFDFAKHPCYFSFEFVVQLKLLRPRNQLTCITSFNSWKLFHNDYLSNSAWLGMISFSNWSESFDWIRNWFHVV